MSDLFFYFLVVCFVIGLFQIFTGGGGTTGKITRQAMWNIFK